MQTQARPTIVDHTPFAREIARAYLSISDVHTRALIARTFGASGVHAALSRARAAAEEREVEFYAGVRATSQGFSCDCVTCRVYGGDCYRSLAHDGLSTYLARWQRRAGLS